MSAEQTTGNASSGANGGALPYVKGPAEYTSEILKVNTEPFKGKVIAISGASRGTGLATAKYLLIRGASVSISSSSDKGINAALEEIKTELPEHQERVIAAKCDIRNLEEVESWISLTLEKFGKLDGCANVAGKEQKKLFPITDYDMNEFDEIMDTNVKGLFHLLRVQMKHIVDGGSIVNVNSVSGHYGAPFYAAYAASKFAARGISKAAAFEGAARGIRVNSIFPGTINSEMQYTPFELPGGASYFTSAATLPQFMKRYVEPEEVAANIAHLLGHETRFVTKSEWFIDGGWIEGNLTS